MASEVCTVVSIFPFQTMEFKPGLSNGRFIIPAAPEGDFIVVHISDSFYMERQLGTDRSLKIPVLAEDIAKSIINDFSDTHVGSSDGAKPGMFFVPGKLSKAEILSKHKIELEAAKKSQINWLTNLVALADDDFSRFHQVKMINDTQKYAARFLKLEREWLIDYTANLEDANNSTKCEACQTVISKLVVKCASCGYIRDKVKAMEMGLIPKEK